MQSKLLETQGAYTADVPEHGPSVAVKIGQVSIVPLKETQF